MNSKLKALFIGEFTWKRFLRSLILVPLCVAFGLLVIALFFADFVIFRPPTSSYIDTSNIIKLKTETGETISAKFYRYEGARHTILFSHGNAEDLGSIEPYILELRDSGVNVLTFDYSGYGTSGGTPSEINAYADIDAAYEYLISQKRISPNKIILHGRSLGGAIAIDLASRKRVAGLILESSFTSAFKVVTRYPVLPFDKFKSVDKIGSVRCPLLLIHGTNDRTIPMYHGERLFEAANEPKKALWVDGAGHNDLFYKDQDRYLNTIADFAKSLQPE